MLTLNTLLEVIRAETAHWGGPHHFGESSQPRAKLDVCLPVEEGVGRTAEIITNEEPPP